MLSVYFIDVGQGDAILIDYGATEVLIDGGTGGIDIVPFLRGRVEGNLEVMVASHTDADHIGGLDDVLAAFQVTDIWLNGDTATTQAYQRFKAAVNDERAITHTAKRGDTILVDGLSFKVLNPPPMLFSDANNNSVVLHLAYGSADFLFTGDAEKEAEAGMLVQSVVPVPDVEILKVGHHASRSSSSAAFLQATKPEIAIYMAGVDNRYGHPHPETIAALEAVGTRVYGTDKNGTITVTTNGQTYTVNPPIPALMPSSLPVALPAPTQSLAPNPTPTPLPTATPTAAPAPARGPNVQITRIFYDGLVRSVESDEYVEIANLGDEPQNMQGWVLKDISDGYPSFTFPSYILNPGAIVRVYTNEIHAESGGFSFGYGRSIWNNTDPDTAGLFDAQGREVSRRSY